MPVDNVTPNRNWPLPNGTNNLAYDVGRLIAALQAADLDVATILSTLVQKAPLLNAALAGAPTAPTPGGSDNSTRIATTQWARAYFADIVGAAPAALDTLAELALALGNDANFAATMTAALAAKAPLASPALTGTPTAATAAPGTNTTQLATTAFVAALGALKANLASPTFTGTPAAPTAADGTNTTQLATTGFVQQVIALFKAAANTFTAAQTFQMPAGVTNMATATPAGHSIMALGDATKAAYITLHRSGTYAGLLGLDTDNKLKWGGWSVGANAYEIVHMGNYTSLLDARYALAGAAAPAAIIEDQKAAGTNGGGATAGSWQIRDLNTEVRDPFGLITVSSNTFTATVAGWVEWSAPSWAVGLMQTRLYNVTDAVVAAYGSSERSGFGSDGVTRSFGAAPIIAGKTYRLEHRVESTRGTTGYGYANNFGGTEVYSRVQFWRT
ncbi:hypothetical protein EN742_11300 [Mesorhizobium sp. M4A.F.Ca.ET.020.02.1.1]|uniref:hypothetical protein n=1 Tax=unclassified Mesorhizobium TaxID=325217 RepID=UPI000FD27B6D|nr:MULTISPECIES: hypothetical protein [unclassified Mesorhizobium]RVD40993.1 hypothetical protein EN742_11300 [Mesorhizobium sp. M4A.F.Ca.ET.020.02.1.1]RWC20053.1 MAG: hypothetical protein EOS53_11070 [Mesorhizobium sp.]